MNKLYLSKNSIIVTVLTVFSMLLAGGFVFFNRNKLFVKGVTSISPSAVLTFSPNTINTAPGSSFNVVVNLNTGGVGVVGTDLLIRFNKDLLLLEDILVSGNSILKSVLPVTSSGAFNRQLVLACANTGSHNGSTSACSRGAGIIQVGLAAYDWSSNTTTGMYTGNFPAATLSFKAKKSGQSSIRFIPTEGVTNTNFTTTTDSNVVAIPTGGDPLDVLITPKSRVRVNVDDLTLITTTPSPTPTPTPTDANTVSLYPVADTYVTSAEPNKNRGKTTSLHIDGSPVEITYMKFDLEALAGKNINTARLKVRVTNYSPSDYNVKRVPNTSWKENEVTYNNKLDIGAIISTFAGADAGTWIEIDITNFVKDRKGSLMSLGFDGSGSNGLDFNSRESGESNSPKLEITFN
ncbi:hypothetical protein A2793_00075 [candidate division WWE3 bacterium RIFCSPHIGHO2_01_FULL_38_45]|nr:MAG: hypothetical protein A2793_00075 [candidate division WWE3 bacterium RIFCSPHIGHO2_01_FULL_38_45]